MATLSKRYADYRRNAATRGFIFEVSKDRFAEITSQPCEYCGQTEGTIGIDRVNSDIGYLEGNMVPCCSFCNRMKTNFGAEAFLAQVARIASHKQLV